MKSKFKIIRNDFPIYTENEKGYLRSNIIAYALVGIFLLSLLIFKFSFAINIAFIMLGTFIFELLKGRQHNWISKEEEAKGELILSSDTIEIQPLGEIIVIDDVEKMKMYFTYVAEAKKQGGYIIHNGVAELEIIQKSNESKKLKFVFESNEQFDSLKKVFKDWYIKGVEIEERFMKQKIETICLQLKSDFKYQELQDFKKLLNKK